MMHHLIFSPIDWALMESKQLKGWIDIRTPEEEIKFDGDSSEFFLRYNHTNYSAGRISHANACFNVPVSDRNLPYNVVVWQLY